jgi:hypothetical protein
MFGPLEGVAEGLQCAALQLFDCAHTLVHHLCGFIKSQPGDDSQKHSFALFVTQRVNKPEDAVFAEAVGRRVFG